MLMFTWTLVQWKQDGTMLSSCRAEKDLSTQGRATCRGDAGGEDHRPLAARARHGEGRPHGFANGTPPEKKVHLAKGTHRGGAEETEVSHGACHERGSTPHEPSELTHWSCIRFPRLRKPPLRGSPALHLRPL